MEARDLEVFLPSALANLVLDYVLRWWPVPIKRVPFFTRLERPLLDDDQLRAIVVVAENGERVDTGLRSSSKFKLDADQEVVELQDLALQRVVRFFVVQTNTHFTPRVLCFVVVFFVDGSKTCWQEEFGLADPLDLIVAQEADFWAWDHSVTLVGLILPFDRHGKVQFLGHRAIPNEPAAVSLDFLLDAIQRPVFDNNLVLVRLEAESSYKREPTD